MQGLDVLVNGVDGAILRLVSEEQFSLTPSTYRWTRVGARRCSHHLELVFAEDDKTT